MNTANLVNKIFNWWLANTFRGLVHYYCGRDHGGQMDEKCEEGIAEISTSYRKEEVN